AAGLASLNVIMDNQLLHHVEKKGALIEELLRHNVVREIRREGLMLAVDLPTEKMVEKLVTRCLQKGVLLFWFLSCRNSFRIAPPLTITEEEIKHACNIIREQLDMLETDP
ncbi:MAG: aminotransferase class III-fold pyridoxal phosphate-dependent enzyme, partial [Cyclobacteriaceae bacterium]|nr:aminotransferase class III-fold pyridoxal phosphate-dependent enzyme [Cyclobacteriaceae bacterium]